VAGKNKKKAGSVGTIAAQNRRARHDYEIVETFEAGIMLTGTEVKSIRAGRASIVEAHGTVKGGEVWLMNAHIDEYGGAKHFQHAPKRPRKLLLHGREVEKLSGAVHRQGMALVPLDIHFNPRGIAKITLALAKGRRKADKREAVKDQEWKRQKERLLRAR
jgi:SsrA-binding protein